MARLDGVPGIHNVCFTAGSVGIDNSGNVLVSFFLDTADVIRFPASEESVGQILRPDRRLFFPPAGTNFWDGRGLRYARGVAVWGDQLIVSDRGSHDVLEWTRNPNQWTTC